MTEKKRQALKRIKANITQAIDSLCLATDESFILNPEELPHPEFRTDLSLYIHYITKLSDKIAG